MKKYKHIYSVTTGMIDPFEPESRYILDFMFSCKGFIAIHNTPDFAYSLWMYDTEENAKKARNLANSQGIDCGPHIGRFKWDGKEDCAADMDDEWIKTHSA